MEQRLGPYRLLARIGRGGMGETFVGEKTGPAGFVHRVCVKRIISADAAAPAWVRMFQAEARIAAQLRHPTIVSLHDFGHDGGNWWMSLELVEGIDLRSLAAGLAPRGERLPVDRAPTAITREARALDRTSGPR